MKRKSKEFQQAGRVRQEHHFDAAGQPVGRLASRIAHLLRGKNQVDFVPHLDVGDRVTVTNVEQVVLTRKKWEKKIYYHHTNYPGHLREEQARHLHARDPKEVLRRAVHGMLPANRLRREWMKKLTLTVGMGTNKQPQDKEPQA